MKWVWKKFSELTLDELYSIIRAREEVFVVEQKLSYVDCDNYDQKAWHLLGFEEDNLLAYLRVFPPGIKYPEASFGRVLTLKKARGKGIGKELTSLGLANIRNEFGETTVRISAQAYLENFYTSFGFNRVGEIYLEEGIPHLQMVTKLPVKPD